MNNFTNNSVPAEPSIPVMLLQLARKLSKHEEDLEAIGITIQPLHNAWVEIVETIYLLLGISKEDDEGATAVCECSFSQMEIDELFQLLDKRIMQAAAG